MLAPVAVLLVVALIVVFVVGTNCMKMGKIRGVVITVAAFVASLSLVEGEFAALFLLSAYICNPGIIFGTVRFALNYRYYKELSHMEGFPSFIRTTADLYADKIYIVDKKEVVKRKDPSEKVIRVMDIGYDNEPPKEDKAWNAFDYMDEENDEKDDTDES
jgi:hypothetical protein